MSHQFNSRSKNFNKLRNLELCLVWQRARNTWPLLTMRATTVINPCNKLWQIHEKTLTNLLLTLNFKVLVTMIGFGSDTKCWSVFVDLYLYIFMYIYICMFINKFISWYKLRNISGSASNLCCIIDALLRFCNDDWCILSQIENVVVWIQNISHLTTMCTYIWISKEGCP